MTASASLRGRALAMTVLLAGCALPFALQAAGMDYYVSLASRILVFAIAATGLNLVLGYGGMVSLGHAAFVGIGSYAGAVLIVEGVPGAGAHLLATLLASGLAALVIGAISLRTRGVYFIMITLAFAQMVYYVAVGLKRYGGEDGLNLPSKSTLGFGIDLGSDIAFYHVVLAILVAVLVVFDRMLDARFGRALFGIRENEARMEALGYPTSRFRLTAFAVAGGVAGLAGALFANHNLFVSPSVLHWTQSATFVVMVILGGIGYRYGGVLGALVLLLLEEVLAAYTEFWHLPLGVLLLAVVFLAPQGLSGWLERKAAR